MKAAIIAISGASLLCAAALLTVSIIDAAKKPRRNIRKFVKNSPVT